jgi:hypothetical protein
MSYSFPCPHSPTFLLFTSSHTGYHFCILCTLFLCVYVVPGLELRAYTLSHSTSLFLCVLGIFEIGSHKLFARTGFKHDPPNLCCLSS